jgi:hypothetical protein
VVAHLNDYADERLVYGCIYCGGPEETKEHAPSKVFLDVPFPENLPIVRACRACNNSFSLDEEYVACLLECVLSGTTEPEAISRERIASTLARSPQLKARIEAARTVVNGQPHFSVEADRIRNVLLKLARGHAVFELSRVCRDEPDHFQVFLTDALTPEQRDAFDAPHLVRLWGEIGSRGHQRLQYLQLQLQHKDDQQEIVLVPLCDWVSVQEGRYRFLAVDDIDGVVINIVIREYLACEVRWTGK